MNHLIQAPENNLRVISNLFRQFVEIFTGQGAPSVSMTPVANFATSAPGVLDTGGKYWEQYQTAVILK